MKNDVSIYVGSSDRAHLERLVADRNTARKVVWRAGIVLATAEGLGTMAIVRRTGKPVLAKAGIEAVRLALAGALCRGGRGRSLARQDASFPQEATLGGGEAEGADQDGERNARQCDALERARHGQGGRH